MTYSSKEGLKALFGAIYVHTHTHTHSQKWLSGKMIYLFIFPPILTLVMVLLAFPAYVSYEIGKQPTKVVSPSHG